MKKILTFIFIFTVLNSRGQGYIQEWFEYPNDHYRNLIRIDTAHHAHNIWQIGKPAKAVLDSAFSYPYAIVTDTLHTYPANDTSVFFVDYPVRFWPYICNFYFLYKLDIDSSSKVKIELTGDRGVSWIDPLVSDTAYHLYWGGTKPSFDTNRANWSTFDLNMENWARAYAGGPDTFPHYRTADTITFRFTFISGSDTSVHRDGWIMDNFRMQVGAMEGLVKATATDALMGLYPNPSNGSFYCDYQGNLFDDAQVAVLALNGAVVYQSTMPVDHYLNLPLNEGAYLARFSKPDGSNITKRIVISAQ